MMEGVLKGVMYKMHKVVPQVTHACIVVNIGLNYHGTGNKFLKCLAQ